MALQIRYAIVVAGFILIAALVYIELPGFSARDNDATSTSRAVLDSPTVQLKGRTIRVDVADTPEERARGLSGRESLAEDEGMLFVFQEDGLYAFWMKDMHFAIDILWISSEGVVVDMEQNISPSTYPTSFVPRREARYVIELPAGATAEYDLELGDMVRL